MWQPKRSAQRGRNGNESALSNDQLTELLSRVLLQQFSVVRHRLSTYQNPQKTKSDKKTPLWVQTLVLRFTALQTPLERSSSCRREVLW